MQSDEEHKKEVEREKAFEEFKRRVEEHLRKEAEKEEEKRREAEREAEERRRQEREDKEEYEWRIKRFFQ